MKKTLLFLFISLSMFSLRAQNVQFHWDFLNERNYPTVTIEMFKPDRLGSTYFFVDFDFPRFKDMGLAYMELSRNFKLGNFPVMLHGEYNGGLFVADNFGGHICNAWLVGGSWPFSIGKSYFELIATYKHITRTDKKANAQLTGVWTIPLWKEKIICSGFIDLWSEDKFGEGRELVIISEPQFWYNFNNHIAVGTEIEISSNFVENKCKVFPTLGAKWTF